MPLGSETIRFPRHLCDPGDQGEYLRGPGVWGFNFSVAIDKKPI
jgi:hypothetical protein